jgi:hypothetical protein
VSVSGQELPIKSPVQVCLDWCDGQVVRETPRDRAIGRHSKDKREPGGTGLQYKDYQRRTIKGRKSLDIDDYQDYRSATRMGQEKGGAGSRNKPERERLEGLDSSIKSTREIPGVLYLGNNQPCMSDRWKCRSGSTGIGARYGATQQAN